MRAALKDPSSAAWPNAHGRRLRAPSLERDIVPAVHCSRGCGGRRRRGYARLLGRRDKLRRGLHRVRRRARAGSSRRRTTQGLAAEQGLGRSRAGGFAVEIDLTAPILLGGLVVGIDGEALGQCVRAEQGRRVNEDGLVHRS